MILKQRGFNKPSTEIIRLSAFQNHLFSLIYIISEQGEIAQARIIREDMRQGLGYLERRFQGGGSLLVAVLAYLAMNNSLIQHVTFNFLGLQLVIMACVLLMGNYTGYRLSELKRFKPLADELKK